MSGESEKVKISSTCLLSHPDKCLKEHLNGVRELVKVYFPLKDEELLALAELSALFHDAGKATECFQRYIRGEKPACPKEHSLLSALLLLEHLKKSSYHPIKALFGFVAVRRHHSFPGDFFNKEGKLGADNKRGIKILLEKIPEGALSKIGIDENLKRELKSHFPNQVERELRPLRSLNKFKVRLEKESEEMAPLELYSAFLSIYSSLLLADRQDAVGLPSSSLFKLNYKRAKSFIDSLSKKREIDLLREKAKKVVLSKEFNPEKRIYSINLPTGYGKTYTGFLFALKIVEEMRKKGEEFKIIYALPFISIIEQNYEALKELLLKTHGRADSDVILKHHHLAELAYKREGEEVPFEYSKLLTESWESSVITTTMVQLFNALFPKNRNSAMRFARLSKSVIILDEVQTIPLELWKITRRVLLELSERLDFYIIFMTATKPMIFEEDEYVELADKNFFRGLNRYQVSVEIEKTQTLRELVEKFKAEKGKRYLFIVNTIRSSQELYSLLIEKGLKEEEVEYLSSSVIPYDRRRRIKNIDNARILVSTQVVEAGMDIDFDEVIRDLAPFDALNQSAGRCNRSGRKSGIFRIVHLVDENNGNKPYYSYIYDSLLVSATREALKGKKHLTEEEFTLLVEDYFKEVKNRGVNAERLEELFDAVKFLRFRTAEKEPSIEKIKLIAEDYPKEEVFVQFNKEAVEIFNKMKEIVKRLRRRDREAFKEFLKLKPSFYDFVAKVNLKDKIKPPFDRSLSIYYVPLKGFGKWRETHKDDRLSIYYVPLKDLKSYYGKTGLKEPELLW